MSTINVLIYGGGGFSREVAWLLQSIEDANKKYRFIGFIDDNTHLHGKLSNNYPIMSLERAYAQHPDAQIVSGIGNPKIRQHTIQKALNIGFRLATPIHPRAEMSQWIDVGAGTVICAGNILTTNIQLGKCVQINLDCTIGHDVVMGDYTTLAPGVHISGWVHMGQRVYIGTGATVINGTREKPLILEDDVVIGAGACVVKSLPSGVTAVGIPAKPISK